MIIRRAHEHEHIGRMSIFNYTLILRCALFRYNCLIRFGPAAKKSQNFSKVSFFKSLNLLVVLV